ncbi:MAG: hypothetical protein AAFV95_25550 [Bacteroidota bacterium]
MATRRPSRRSFSLNQGEAPEPIPSQEVDKYSEEFEPNPLLKKAVKWVILFVLFAALGTYFVQRDAIAKVRAQTAEQNRKDVERERREIEIGRKNALAFEEARQEALTVLEEEKYFEAVFKLRNALSYDGHDLMLREKLLLALENSCEGGNEMHCLSIEKEKKIIASLKEQSGKQ